MLVELVDLGVSVSEPKRWGQWRVVMVVQVICKVDVSSLCVSETLPVSKLLLVSQKNAVQRSLVPYDFSNKWYGL